MWGTVLVVGVMGAVDPVRLGIVLLLISRPRPMRNLLAYWFGAMATATGILLGLLILVRNLAPMLSEHVAAAATSSTARHIQVAGGALALSIAAMIAVGFSARQRARLPMSGGGPSAPRLQPRTPTVFSRLSRLAQDVLKGESSWVAGVVGLGSTAQLQLVLPVLTAMVASGTAIGAQVGAAIAFVVIMLAFVEIPLVSYLFTPAKTQAVMSQLHDWVFVHRRRIVAVIVGVIGVFLLASGIGIV